MGQSHLALVVASTLATTSAYAEITFDLMHTRPECAQSGKPGTWCTSDDSPKAAKLSGMEAKLVEMLDQAKDPAKSRITIAYFSFSNRAAYDKLCERGKAGIPIEGFFDQSYRGEDKLPSQLAKCQGPSGKNVRVHFLGKTDTTDQANLVWRLHHNKFLVVDSGVTGAPLRVCFSSGNLSSSGLSIHFDHWVMMNAPRSSNLVKQQFCVIESLRKAIAPNASGTDAAVDDPSVYRSSLNKCFDRVHSLWTSSPTWAEKAVKSERVAPLFSPDPSDSLYRVLVGNIGRVAAGGKIYGAMQHFLHTGIAKALRDAAARGVQVRLLMDDDVVLGDSEVPGVKEFYNSQLKGTKLQIRFMQTNSAAFQMMHNKFLVMEKIDGKTRVFSGAGHFTTSGMRNNYENFYLTEDAGLAAKYNELFEYMIGKSVAEKDVKKFQ